MATNWKQKYEDLRSKVRALTIRRPQPSSGGMANPHWGVRQNGLFTLFQTVGLTIDTRPNHAIPTGRDHPNYGGMNGPL